MLLCYLVEWNGFFRDSMWGRSRMAVLLLQQHYCREPCLGMGGENDLQYIGKMVGRHCFLGEQPGK